MVCGDRPSEEEIGRTEGRVRQEKERGHRTDDGGDEGSRP